MATCLFCRASTSREPVEHIVPEGLIGHQPFRVTKGSIVAEPNKYLVLEHDEVCRGCNHKLGRLDSYLQDQFGFLRTYWNTVGTKSGRRATARRPGMFAEHRADGPHISFNMEKHAISTPDGVRIPAARAEEMAVRVKDFAIDGRFATMTVQQPTRMNKRFVRALHKIGFELLCLNRGPAFVLHDKFDPIREYVLHGRGSREIVIGCVASDGWEHPHFGLQYDAAWPGWLATVRLGAAFYVDLSPANEFFTKASHNELMANNLMKWSDRNGGTPVSSPSTA